MTALEKSHCFFPDLLALFPKADYHTIATAVGQLHQQGKIMQDGEGKYQMKGRDDPERASQSNLPWAPVPSCVLPCCLN